jgi:hypothetical protein
VSDDTDINVKISAESSAAKEGMQQASAAVKEGVAQMKESLGSLSDVFKMVNEHFVAFAAVLAGGKLFKEGISEAKALTGETLKLAKSMGISMQDASTLNVALKSIGSSADSYADANAKLTRQIRTNEEAVNDMGVKTRGANGELLDGKTIMTNALTALASYKEGTDRNLAGQQLFGKGAAEVTALLKLNSKVMEEAAEKAERLGLVIGPEQAAKTKAYKEGMEEVKLILEALQVAIGQAVMPVLTEMAGWFEEIGPTAVGLMRTAMNAFADVCFIVIDVAKELWGDIKDIFSAIGSLVTDVAGTDIPSAMQIWKNAMIVIEVAALALKNGIVIAFEMIRAAVLVLISDIKRWGEIAYAAFHLDWAGIKAAWSSGTGEVEKIIAESQKRIVDKSIETAETMQRVLMGGPLKEPTAAAESSAKKGTRSYVDPNNKPGANSDLLKAQFAIIKAQLEGQLAIQKEYLAEAAELYEYAYKHNKISIQEYYADKLATEKAALNASIQIKEEEIRETQALEARATKPQDKLALKAQEIRMTAELTVLTAKLGDAEAKNARDEKDAEDDRQRRLAEIKRLSTQQAGTSAIDMDRIASQQRHALRQTTDAQALQEEKSFQQRQYQIDLQAQQDRYALIDGDPVKWQQIHDDIEQLHRKHAEEMARIDSQIVLESQKDVLAAQSAIEGAFEGFLSNLGNRTQTVKQQFQSLISSIESSLMKLAAKKLMEQILGGISGGGGGGNWLGALIGGASGAIPAFAAGTNYVPNDMLAVIHKGEAIVPAKYNQPGATGGGANITNHFHLPGPTDTRTQAQIASKASFAMQTAMRRNG